MTEPQELLADYVRSGSESAFRELVTRYVDLVFSTAVRLLDGDTHRAEDVSQIVFTDLARKASTLSPNSMLGGWLHQHTCFVARTMLRGERRREARERQAVEMNAIRDPSDGVMTQLAPVLDEAIHQLGADDRDAILLRFFERRNLRSVGDVLGVTENVAQKRVARAVEELGALLRKQGVTLSAAALAAGLAEGVVTAAPLGLAGSLAGSALASAGASGGTALTAAKCAVVAKSKIALVSAILVLGAGTTLYFQSLRSSPSGQAKLAPVPQSEPAPSEAPPVLKPVNQGALVPSEIRPAPPPPPGRPAPPEITAPTDVPVPVPRPIEPPAMLAPSGTPGGPPILLRAKPGKDMKIRLEGTSSVHNWQVEGNIIAGSILAGPGFPLTPGQIVPPGKVDAEVQASIPVNSLKSVEASGRPYSDKMDEIMIGKLKCPPHRVIRFALSELTLKDTPGAHFGEIGHAFRKIFGQPFRAQFGRFPERSDASL